MNEITKTKNKPLNKLFVAVNMILPKGENVYLDGKAQFRISNLLNGRVQHSLIVGESDHQSAVVNLQIGTVFKAQKVSIPDDSGCEEFIYSTFEWKVGSNTVVFTDQNGNRKVQSGIDLTKNRIQIL